MARLSEAQIQQELSQLPHWRREGEAIVREVRCADFKEALLLINAVGHFAEKANHHPEIHNVYRHVTFRLSTHDAGGLTEKDFALARQIDALLE
ncbi:MAG: putative pterin-4-alpha-carbinolamine dehydratase [Candidatus Poribacteria bacterium]|nr:MAG: putative pterin-4-alpha-carbinolamine dehydratase [Candidatus Poribacteria bacterium]